MRLVDADELIKSAPTELGVPIWQIEDAPTVDAVEVVRCKDCKWYERKFPWNRHSYECSYLEAPMDDNDYCSLGERREDAKTG